MTESRTYCTYIYIGTIREHSKLNTIYKYARKYMRLGCYIIYILFTPHGPKPRKLQSL